MRKHSPCQVIFSPPYTLTTVLFSDSVLGTILLYSGGGSELLLELELRALSSSPLDVQPPALSRSSWLVSKPLLVKDIVCAGTENSQHFCRTFSDVVTLPMLAYDSPC